MGTTGRRERDKNKMRELILTSAFTLFVKEGFEKITIRRIAEHIEYSPGIIYHYFKDKKDILYALQARGFEELHKRLQDVLAIKHPLLRLKKQFRIFVSFGREMPEYYDLMFLMRGPTKWTRETDAATPGRRAYDFLKDNVRECMRARYLVSGDPDIVSFSFLAHVNGIVLLIVRERIPMFPSNQVDAVVEGALAYFTKCIEVHKV